MSGRKEAIASLKGYAVLFENPMANIFQGAVYVMTWLSGLSFL
jgi:hypothetical protein